MKTLDSTIRSLLQGCENFLVISHIRADGDAIGSVLGFGLALRAAGKKVQMVLPDGVPQSFKHLSCAEEVVKRPVLPYEMAVVVDCSDLQRSGGILNGRIPDLNIDHHVTNLNFAKYNFVDAESAATSSILADSLPRWGFSIPLNAAEALLSGIVSDSLGFRTTNVTPQTLRSAASMMELGANLSRLYNRALIQRSYESALFWGRGLALMERRDRLIWTTLSLEDRTIAKYPGNDDADLINFLSTIDDFDISIIFVEHKNGRVKVSWRAQPGWNVAKIALQFGGGGHAAAAGADVAGTLEEVKEKVLKTTFLVLESTSQML